MPGTSRVPRRVSVQRSAVEARSRPRRIHRRVDRVEEHVWRRHPDRGRRQCRSDRYSLPIDVAMRRRRWARSVMSPIRRRSGGRSETTIHVSSGNPNDDACAAVSVRAAPARRLCVAVSFTGHVITSSNPTGGSGAWASADADGSNQISAIACPTATLCVAGDAAINVVTSTNPTGGAAAWTVAHVDGTNDLNDVSCATTTLCVAVDNAGNIVTSTNPTGGAGAWDRHQR